MGQADAGDNEAKLMTKLAPEWVRTSDPVIRSPARYRWTTAPATSFNECHELAIWGVHVLCALLILPLFMWFVIGPFANSHVISAWR